MILLITLAFSLLVAPQAAQTQPRGHLPRLGVLDPSPHQRPAPCLAACRQGLRDLGYVEGQNLLQRSSCATSSSASP